MNAVIPCLGQLNIPRVPQFEGMDKYKGEAFHSSEWKKDYDPTGRKVAIIGTGASAVQIVPTIAPKVNLNFSVDVYVSYITLFKIETFQTVKEKIVIFAFAFAFTKRKRSRVLSSKWAAATAIFAAILWVHFYSIIHGW